MAQQDPNGFGGGLLGPWLAQALARGSQSQFAPMSLADQSPDNTPMPAPGSLAAMNPFVHKPAAPAAPQAGGQGLFSGVNFGGGAPGGFDPDELAGLY